MKRNRKLAEDKCKVEAARFETQFYEMENNYDNNLEKQDSKFSLGSLHEPRLIATAGPSTSLSNKTYYKEVWFHDLGKVQKEKHKLELHKPTEGNPAEFENLQYILVIAHDRLSLPLVKASHQNLKLITLIS